MRDPARAADDDAISKTTYPFPVCMPRARMIPRDTPFVAVYVFYLSDFWFYIPYMSRVRSKKKNYIYLLRYFMHDFDIHTGRNHRAQFYISLRSTESFLYSACELIEEAKRSRARNVDTKMLPEHLHVLNHRCASPRIIRTYAHYTHYPTCISQVQIIRMFLFFFFFNLNFFDRDDKWEQLQYKLLVRTNLAKETREYLSSNYALSIPSDRWYISAQKWKNVFVTSIFHDTYLDEH